MAELSKTAKASMVQAPKTVKAEESVEEAIRQLRLNLEAGLHITSDRIRKLLEAYDSLVVTFRGTTILLSTQTERVQALEQAVTLRDQELQKYLDLGKEIVEADAKNGHSILPTATEIEARQGCGPLDFVTMKDPVFDHPEEDTSHPVNYGHETTHAHSEGA